jgi:hypothetical protein
MGAWCRNPSLIADRICCSRLAETIGSPLGTCLRVPTRGNGNRGVWMQAVCRPRLPPRRPAVPMIPVGSPTFSPTWPRPRAMRCGSKVLPRRRSQSFVAQRKTRVLSAILWKIGGTLDGPRTKPTRASLLGTSSWNIVFVTAFPCTDTSCVLPVVGSVLAPRGSSEAFWVASWLVRPPFKPATSSPWPPTKVPTASRHRLMEAPEHHGTAVRREVQRTEPPAGTAALPETVPPGSRTPSPWGPFARASPFGAKGIAGPP